MKYKTTYKHTIDKPSLSFCERCHKEFLRGEAVHLYVETDYESDEDSSDKVISIQRFCEDCSKKVDLKEFKTTENLVDELIEQS